MFKRLSGAEDASKILLDRCIPVSGSEKIALENSPGRVVSSDMISGVNLPSFNRAAMDGYAVRSSDTRGASPNAPVYLALGQDCAPVRTGMPVQETFDAVVMIEDTIQRKDQVEVTAEVHPYRNVAKVGEDIAIGDLVLKEGHRLRPPDLALLGSLGIESVEVYSMPKVAVIPTGGELVPRFSRSLNPGEAYETNGLMASLYTKIWGGEPKQTQVVPDDPELIKKAIKSNLDCDLIVLTGGTSVGEKDFAPKVLQDLGEMLIHGVRIQPGKPTTLGAIGKTPVICLPGYPVAALSALYLFVRPALKKLAHLHDQAPKVQACLGRKIASRPGYQSLVRVALHDGIVEPIMASGAGILSSVARADGFVIVPEESEGMEAGEEVEVSLFE
jgi:molybdopterin molybdotransferase